MKTRRGFDASFARELELLARDVDVPAGDGDGAADAVDHELAHLVSLRRPGSDPAEDRADPRDELVVDERRDEVVVGTAGERPHAVEDIRLLRPEDDHRHIPVPRSARLAFP